MANITRLPCATYKTDIPASLRILADEIESGETALPESVVIISSGEQGVEVFSQGMRADDDVFTIGLFEMGKNIIIGAMGDENDGY